MPREQPRTLTVYAIMRRVLPMVILISACVSTGTYNAKVAELTKSRQDDAAAAKAREDALNDQLATSKKAEAETQVELQKADTDKADLQKKLDEGTALVASLKQRLESLGQNADSLAKEKGQLTQAMADATARLDELRKQKAAAEARAATFHNLIAKLRSMIDSGQLKVAIRNGRMLIALPNDILFDSGQTAVKPDGKAALGKVAQVLATVNDRDFLVAGHTDNVPIKTQLYPSNWELSTRRAVEVVHILISQGMNPKLLAAGGYGEFDPVVPNDTNEHRAQNRRIEIVLQPNLSDLPPLDDGTPTTTAAGTKPKS
jgi:chemotaxis protein MotB